MQLDICVIITVAESDSGLKQLVEQLVDLLNAEQFTHEITIVCAENLTEDWSTIKDLSSIYSAITGFLIKSHSISEASALCGALYSKSKYCITVDSNFGFNLRELLPLYFVINKSNCDLVYGYSAAFNNKLSNNIALAARHIFSFFSGVSTHFSSTRIFESNLCTDISVKTPYFFMFDRLLKSNSKNHTYIQFNKSRAIKNRGITPIKFRQIFLRLFANSRFGETLTIVLLSLNIWVLMNAHLLYAFYIAISATLIVWTIYLLKWRRRIAFKVLEKTSV